MTEIASFKQPKNKIEKAILYCKHYGPRKTLIKIVRKLMGHDQEHYSYKQFLKAHPLTEEELDRQRRQTLDYRPCISIVIPLYNTNERFLTELVQSVLAQTYANWQLCLADGSPAEGLQAIIEKACGGSMDERISYKFLGSNEGIAGNTNAAIDLATGDYIAFCDHDDLLTPDAMYQVAAALNQDSTIDCLYSDEDKIDMSGKEYFLPHFKSDFNIDLLCSHNYITHLFVCRRQLVETVGGIRSEYDGAQDHDFDLQIVEQARNIYHIPRVLYHWRCHSESTADHPEAKMYAYENGRRAVEDHYRRIGIPARVELDSHLGYYRTRYEWPDTPLVSIIIPNMDHKQELQECLDSITSQTTYKNIEFIIVENNSTTDEIRDYYRQLEARKDFRFMVEDYTLLNPGTAGQFNFSALVNHGVSFATGEYLLLLNNDTRMIGPDAIAELLGHAMRPDVGAAGARLYFANNTVQHAGLVLGLGGVANSQFLGSGREQVGYFYRSTCVQDLSAVTGACMLTRRSLYQKVGGFAEDLAVAFNDVDYCLKLRSAGYLIVYNPFSEWYHLESISRGYDQKDEQKLARMEQETAVFTERWRAELEAGDPYYNPNLSLKSFDYSFRVEV